jgi:hypothetical protein
MQRAIGAGFGQPSSKSCSSTLHDQYRGVALCADDEGPTSFQRQSYDYARHGVTTSFAALEMATGQVTDACHLRRRRQEFLRFLKKVAAAYPRTELHVICDNCAHKRADVRAWLARNPSRRPTAQIRPTAQMDHCISMIMSITAGRPDLAILPTGAERAVEDHSKEWRLRHPKDAPKARS